MCAYIRPEADFTTLEDLVKRIHMDADVTRAALQDPGLAAHARDPSLQPGAAALAAGDGSGPAEAPADGGP